MCHRVWVIRCNIMVESFSLTKLLNIANHFPHLKLRARLAAAGHRQFRGVLESAQLTSSQYSRWPCICPQNSSMSSFCPAWFGDPRTARYFRPSTVASQLPGLPSTIVPPASVRMTQPAQTSHAQQPPSQYKSRFPHATAQRFNAAEPMLRIERTIAPPSPLVLPSFSNVRTFVTQLLPALSEPHSTPMRAFSRPFNGSRLLALRGSLVLRFKYAPSPRMAE